MNLSALSIVFKQSAISDTDFASVLVRLTSLSPPVGLTWNSFPQISPGECHNGPKAIIYFSLPFSGSNARRGIALRYLAGLGHS